MALPDKFVETMVEQLGQQEAQGLCDALDGQPLVCVRMNPAKIGDEALSSFSALSEAGIDAPIGWSEHGCYLSSRPQFTFDPDFHAGAYYVQEASSQVVGHLLGGVELRGAKVLDLCAAPGGKSTLYGSLVGNDGLVVANEVDRRRAQILADNVRKWGTGNIAVTTCEARQLGDWEGFFDVVAVDAPCSGEGMFRKDIAAREQWNLPNVQMCATRQDEILREAWRALKAGGTLLYSTCTFNTVEDEGSLERLAQWAGEEIAEAEPVAMNPDWGVVVGRCGAFQTFRFFPHHAKGEGFFAAIARKGFDAGGRLRRPKGRREIFSTIDRASCNELSKWCLEPSKMHFISVADTLYGYRVAQMETIKALAESLPMIYAGVAMGQVFKGRLKPDPALAFWIGLKRESLSVIDIDNSRALAFLRCQDIGVDGLEEGINLICARGRALGFVKRIGQRVNNMYSNSMRILKEE